MARLDGLATKLCEIGGQQIFSLGLFNHAYWKQDPLTAAKTGWEKMRTMVDER